MNHYKEVERFIDYVDINLSLPNYKKQLGGGNDTISQPYRTFESLSDKMFEYFKYIYDNKEKNSKQYEESVNDLEKICDCEKYKCNYKSNDDEYQEQDEENPFEKPIILPETNEEEMEEDNDKNPKKHSVLLLKNEYL